MNNPQPTPCPQCFGRGHNDSSIRGRIICPTCNGTGAVTKLPPGDNTQKPQSPILDDTDKVEPADTDELDKLFALWGLPRKLSPANAEFINQIQALITAAEIRGLEWSHANLLKLQERDNQPYLLGDPTSDIEDRIKELKALS